MKVAEKIDLYKLHKNEYAATPRPRLVDVGPAVYLAIDGQGAPGTERFTEAIGAHYGVAFTVKMTRKFGGEQDYAVSKLEALWQSLKKPWRWTLLIRTPEFVTREELGRAAAVLRKRGRAPGAERVTLASIAEGRCVQTLHVGPSAEEQKTIAVMKAFAEDKGLRFDGVHHEIYLSDPRRVAPARLRTILRQPVGRL